MWAFYNHVVHGIFHPVDSLVIPRSRNETDHEALVVFCVWDGESTCIKQRLDPSCSSPALPCPALCLSPDELSECAVYFTLGA